PLQERDRQPGRRGVRIGVHHRSGVDAADRAGRGDLTPEPGAIVLVVRHRRVDDLDGHHASGGRTTEKDLTHTTRTEPTHDTVGPDLPRIRRKRRGHRFSLLTRSSPHPVAVPDPPRASSAYRWPSLQEV